MGNDGDEESSHSSDSSSLFLEEPFFSTLSYIREQRKRMGDHTEDDYVYPPDIPNVIESSSTVTESSVSNDLQISLNVIESDPNESSDVIEESPFVVESSPAVNESSPKWTEMCPPSNTEERINPEDTEEINPIDAIEMQPLTGKTTTIPNFPTTASIPCIDCTNKPRSADKVAAKLGVKPMARLTKPGQRKRASFWFRQLLTISQALDPIRIPNSRASYQCVWWKAMAAKENDDKDDDDDAGNVGSLEYELLPAATRWTVSKPLRRHYPRHHHANVELRTRYLDRALETILDRATTRHSKIRVVLVGAGYDLRLVSLALQYQNKTAISPIGESDDCPSTEEPLMQSQPPNLQPLCLDLVELDLARVVRAKQRLLEKRFLRRRPDLAGIVNRIRMLGVDLNQKEQVESTLQDILESKNQDENEIKDKNDTENIPHGDTNEKWYTIFILEAILLHLDDEVPSQLLSMLSQALRSRGDSGAICFADTLPDVDSNKEDVAAWKLADWGWDLQDWLPKPGRARHMGWAALASVSDDFQ